MPRNRLNVITKLGAAIAFLDKMINKELQTSPLLKPPNDAPRSPLGDYLHTEYILNDMMFPGFWSLKDNTRDASDAERKAEISKFLKMIQFYRDFSEKKEYVVNEFLDTHKFSLPIISSYFVLSYIWSYEVVAFFGTKYWRDVRLDEEESYAKEEEEKNDHKTKSQTLLLAIQELETGLTWELETMNPQLAVRCKERRQDISEGSRHFFHKDTELECQLRSREEENLDFNMSFVRSHRESCPIASAYLYISDILLHELVHHSYQNSLSE